MEDLEFQRRARRGPILMLGRRAGVFGVGLLTTVTTAHVLPPRAYGLAAMSAVMFALAELFKDFGMSSALMRGGKVRAEELNFLFWLNAGSTIVLSLALAAASPLVAAYFHEPVVAWVMLASLLGFIAGGLALQPRALMMRDLRFAEMTTIDIGVLVLQFAVTFGLALVVHNVWAIVAGNVVGAAASCAAYFGRAGWRPGRPALAPDAKFLLRFGLHTTLFSLSVFASNNVGQLLVGRFLGPSMLGQFNRGQTFYLLSIRNAAEPLLQVLLPVLGRLRAEPELYRRTYLGLVRKVSMAVMPGAAILAFAAMPLVEVVLGPRWRVAGEVLAALAPALATFGLCYPASDLFITQDRTSELGVLGLVEMMLRVAAVALAVRFGVVACAAAFSVGTLLSAPLRLGLAGRRGPVSVLDQVYAAAPAAAVAMCAAGGGGLALAFEHLRPCPALGQLALRGAGGVAFGAVGGWASPSSRAALKELAGAFQVSALFGDPRSRRVQAAPRP